MKKQTKPAPKKNATPAKKSAGKKQTEDSSSVRTDRQEGKGIKLSPENEERFISAIETGVKEFAGLAKGWQDPEQFAEALAQRIAQVMDMAEIKRRTGGGAVGTTKPVLFWAHYSGGNLQADRQQVINTPFDMGGFAAWIEQQRQNLEMGNGGTKFSMTNCGIVRD